MRRSNRLASCALFAALSLAGGVLAKPMPPPTDEEAIAFDWVVSAEYVDRDTSEVLITSQNHGFAVNPDTLPKDVETTHRNLNDGTLEGFRHRRLPITAAQFHPEASPGPHDANVLFHRFLESMEQARGKTARP
jgi:hypothetical protein